RWDGQTWSPVDGNCPDTWQNGCGMSTTVSSLAVFDDGTGAALYAAGGFVSAGGVPVQRIAKWDGETWSDVGGGTNALISALEVYDDGTGPALYAAGGFTSAGGVPVGQIA